MEQINSEKLYKGILPLVMHKIVLEEPVEWEDVRKTELSRLLNYVHNRAAVFGDDRCPNEARWLITFDDGNASDYEIVFPLLLSTKISATFFVITERIGQPGYLNWEQIKEMSLHGMCFGSHGHSHLRMTEVPLEVASNEFNMSKKILEDKLGVAIQSFSFPYGDINQDVFKLGITAGYKYLCCSNHGFIDGIESPIPRNSINSKMKWDEIESLLNPNLTTRLLWRGEDLIKSASKNLLGINRYRQLRNAIIR